MSRAPTPLQALHCIESRFLELGYTRLSRCGVPVFVPSLGRHPSQKQTETSAKNPLETAINNSSTMHPLHFEGALLGEALE